MNSFLSNPWKLEIGNHASTPQNICPSDMISGQFEETESEIIRIWKGHPVFGKDLTIQVRWVKKTDGFLSGKISFSGFPCDNLRVEKIFFPTVEIPFLSDSAFLFGGWDLGFILDKTQLVPDFRLEWLYTALQFSAILNKTRPSIYIDHRDTEHSTKNALFEVIGDGCFLRYSGVHILNDSITSHYELPYENTIGEFQGNWFEASQIYKEWGSVQRWNTPRRKMNPLRDIGMWVWNRGPAAKVVPPVIKLQEDLGKIPVALDWYWWHHNPYDTDYPDFWPPREGEENFKDTIANLKKNRIFSQVYINGVCWDLDTASWKEGGDESVVIQRNGTPMSTEFNQYNHHRLGYMCGEAPKFHDRISSLVKHLRDAGLDGQYLDMIGCSSHYACWNPAHHHPKGGGAFSASGYRKMLERLKAEQPEFPLSTECCNEAYMDLLDGVILCNSTSREHFAGQQTVVPLFSAVYHGKMALFGNYAHPDGIPPWDPLWPPEDRWKKEEKWHGLYPDQFFIEMARTVIWGIQPMVCNLTDKIQKEPDFAEIYRFILESARFYYENREFLFDGEMCSPDGFECAEKTVDFFARMIFTKEENATVIRKNLPVILHTVWKSPAGKKAIFLCNYTREEQHWSFRGQNGMIPSHSYKIVPLVEYA